MPLCFFLEKLMPKKGKDVLAIMLGGKGPKGKAGPEEEYDDEEHMEEDGGYGEAFEESARAVMGAIDAGDTEAFTSALKDAIVTCLEEHGGE